MKILAIFEEPQVIYRTCTIILCSKQDCSTVT